MALVPQLLNQLASDDLEPAKSAVVAIVETWLLTSWTAGFEALDLHGSQSPTSSAIVLTSRASHREEASLLQCITPT